MSVPADLRVLSRKLTAASPADLPTLCPVLVGHVLRCGEPLSVSSEQQGKNNTNEATVLVHKLKTQINTLIQGKTPQGRFVGTALAKAIVDVGGWESLRTAEPWVRGLLSLLNKSDPMASKELAVLALTRIYTLLQAYPTLVREIATPTVPTFATACLQLIKPAAPGQPLKAPMNVVETVTRALSALVPLYPTTLRPFAGQIRAAIRSFVAPTASDGVVVPPSLRRSARQLLVVLHYTAAKNGNSDDWSKMLMALLRDAHATADQVFRAIRESRDPGLGFAATTVSFEGEPHGGGDDVDALPAWTGLASGAQRLLGILETLAQVFREPTKLPVAVPLGLLSGLVSRMSVVFAPTSGTQEKDYASLINTSIGREERDELFSVLPSLHAASLELLSSIVTRMGASTVPLAPEILEDAVRMFMSDRHIPRVRKNTYVLTKKILPLVGPSFARTTVDLLANVVRSSCQDILEAGGFLQEDKTDDKSKAGQNGGAKGGAGGGARGKSASANADLFLANAAASSQTAAAAARKTSRLSAAHLRAAENLLAAVLAYIPPQHVKKADRTLLDRTAILSANKGAMVASVLQPYVDQSGRYFANTIPFLARAYPHDVSMEILRSNLRTAPHYYGNIFAATAPGEDDASDAEEEEDQAMDDAADPEPMMDGPESSAPSAPSVVATTEAGAGSGGFSLPSVYAERSKPNIGSLGNAGNATEGGAPAAFEPLTLKRKSDEKDDVPSAAAKKVDTGREAKVPAAVAPSGVAADDSGDDSDGSVQLEMAFDDDDESGDEE
ncbi:hypothetical protein HMPREF1624_02029 [Sporothrix schenckii ATCC 58251]|uniref:Pre-rRNA-processing protein RIX1 n=1 Tax=Sporothrix schenckii (strain ATCC 58251 / de Perez 2211183) TaxID=1391915 RepID=U7Q253_SPOS1|nr:hypothetical protein HMPREF1624_02029 [Sporothrix schenckii ATCC 58251]